MNEDRRNFTNLRKGNRVTAMVQFDWGEPMQPIIRYAGHEDMPALMRLLQLKADFDGCRDGFVATPEALSEAWFGDPPKAFALVADVESELVALATYYPTFSTFLARSGLWLDDLFVRAEYRGRGIGMALMSRLARIAEAQGCGRIEWTVALSNKHGIAFYERNRASIHHDARYVRLSREGVARLATQDL